MALLCNITTKLMKLNGKTKSMNVTFFVIYLLIKKSVKFAPKVPISN